MKRILAMALSLILCLSLSVPALAAESAEVTGEDVYLAVDATGEDLAVELVAATEITDGLVTITYDPAVVSLGEADYTVSGKVTMHSYNASEEGTIKISWISSEAVSGTLFTFEFAKAEGAEITSDTFTVSGTATDEEENTLTIGVNVDTVDKSELVSLVEAVESLTEASYTADSWAAFAEALAAAQSVLQDADATQAEVDQALAALTAAEDGLILKTASSGGGTTTVSGDGTTTASGGTAATTASGGTAATTASGGTPAGTGDDTPVVLLSVIAIFAAAAIVVLLAARRKAEKR